MREQQCGSVSNDLAEGEGLDGLPWALAVAPEAQAGSFDLPRSKAGLKLLQKGPGGLGCHFILDDDVRLEALAVLGSKVVGEGCGEMAVKGQQPLAFKGVGYPFAQRSETCDDDRKPRMGACGEERLCDQGIFRECVKEGDVRVDIVAVGRKVLLAQVIEVDL